MLGDIRVAKDIYIACGYTDMRKSIDGLAALVSEHFQMDPFAPALYIPDTLARVRIRGTNAGKRAAVQIHSRVEIYDKCREVIPGYSKKHSLLYRFAMSLCRFGRIFVNKNSKGKANETVARIMFALPYVLFKLDR